MAGPGHNGHLKSIVDRIEKLNEEKSALGEDITGVYAEAKGQGFDIKVLRKVIAARKMDKAARQEMESLMETYMHNLGMLG